MQKRSLADELAELFDPRPAKETADEDPFDQAPKLAPYWEEAGETDQIKRAKPSLLLRPEVALGAKYEGKKTSRKDLAEEGYMPIPEESEYYKSKSKTKKKGSADDDEEEEAKAQLEDSEDDEENEDSDGVDKRLTSPTRATKEVPRDWHFKPMPEDDDDEISEEEEVDSFGFPRAEDPEETLENELAMLEEEEMNTMKTLKESSEADITKAQHTRNQKLLWNNFLELRIHMQPLIATGNKLPKVESHRQFCEYDYKNKQGRSVTEGFADATASLKSLLGTLVDTQSALAKQNNTFAINITKKRKRDDVEKQKEEKDEEGEKKDEDAEEEDEESEKSDEEEPEEGDDNKTKRPKTENISWEEVAARHNLLGTHMDAVIERWNRKTQLASGAMMNKSFKAINRSILVQISQMLEDKPRLVKRTQLKRTPYHILGDLPTVAEAAPAAATAGNEPQQPQQPVEEETYDQEIFDDTDFYHSLLRELVEAGNAGVTDPILMGRNYLQIKKLRVKQKKKRDQKASKGRKLRYDVLPPLVNFMPPIKGPEPPPVTDELFTSLFGQKPKAA